MKVEVFEEAMCCSTGVCGPEPDEELVKFTETVNKIKEEKSDVDVQRLNMSSNTQKFLNTEEVYDKVQEEGQEVLPVVMADGEIVHEGSYPDFSEMEDLIEEVEA
jgi:disulfide oxidoreductase YuzD